ncbi:MAG: hypothetical protein VB079_09170 [Petrimonas sp.]|uniref:hypothetical protein n=1 Tax=Petrimonas sp. TaxID=2023866 RepID=UPI002B3FEA60|nr:hypothetical protein [Petrimonas sp.]
MYLNIFHFFSGSAVISVESAVTVSHLWWLHLPLRERCVRRRERFRCRREVGLGASRRKYERQDEKKK